MPARGQFYARGAALRRAVRPQIPIKTAGNGAAGGKPRQILPRAPPRACGITVAKNLFTVYNVAMEVALKEGEVLEELFDGKKIIQNSGLYRFTSDSVLLSRFVRGKKGDAVADLCSGSGIVGLHFLCLNPHVSSVALYEMQPALSDMSARTIEFNGFSKARAVCMRVQDIGRELDGRFSLILCNPPYERGGFENASYEKAICRKEITVTLGEILDVSARLLKFGGRIGIINRADRAAELIYGLKSRGLEPKRLQFVCGTAGGKPYLIMAEACKGGREGVDVLPACLNNGRTFGG